jgi:hypothetical protein
VGVAGVPAGTRIHRGNQHKSITIDPQGQGSNWRSRYRSAGAKGEAQLLSVQNETQSAALEGIDIYRADGGSRSVACFTISHGTGSNRITIHLPTCVAHQEVLTARDMA